MAQSERVIEPELWDLISKAAGKRRKNTQNFLREIVLDYLEREEDQRWWRSIQREYRGRAMTEEESVEFVRKIRQEKKQRRNNGMPVRTRTAKAVSAK